VPSAYTVFAATNERGCELWVTDGTTAGTRLLKDINLGAGSSNPDGMTALDDGRIIFSASTGQGSEVWITDGTPEGTVLVSDTAAGAPSCNPREFTVLPGGRAVFSAETASGGRELWVTDGTADGTRMLKDVFPGAETSNPTQMLALTNGTVVFSAIDPEHGTELWVTDGTEAGTTRLEIMPGDGSSYPYELFSLEDGRALFQASGGQGHELYITDGTAEGTRLVADIGGDAMNSDPADFALIRPGVALFAASTSETGRELWQFENDAVTLVRDMVLGTRDFMPKSLTSLGDGRVMYTADARIPYRHVVLDGKNQLWASDGTVEGTKLAGTGAAQAPRNQYSDARDFTLTAAGVVVFVANSGGTSNGEGTGRELWFTDSGYRTDFLLDIMPGSANGVPLSSSPDELTLLSDGRVLFSAAGPQGREVWITDGTAANTILLSDINPGAESSSPHGFTRSIAPDAAPPVVEPPVGSASQPDRDFNGDTKSDLLWRGKDGSLVLWEMNGATIADTALLSNPGQSWVLAGSGDFNADGATDLLWQDADGTLAIWQIGLVLPPGGSIVGNPGDAWSVMAVADLNGDGRADILGQNDDGTVVVWNNADLADSTIVANPGGFWSLKQAADFNGDGKADLLWQGQDASLAMWTMDGGVITKGSYLPNPGGFWTLKEAADFNGDGKADLLWQGQDASLAMWQMDGDSIIEGSYLPNPGEFWSLKEAHDYSGDGKADLLWQGEDHSLVMWQMDGGQIDNAAFLPDPGDYWSIISA
jgi:ELWxxDGT repeat protein